MIISKYWPFKDYQISLILTILAILLWLYSIVHAKFIIGFYGLMSSLPITYFISLGFLTIASFILWISKESHGKLLCFQICLFILALWLMPLLIGTNLVAARWTYSIYYSGTADISQTGHLHPITYWVQNWPTISILESSMEKLFGIALVDFTAKWAIILLQFLLLVPIYLFFKNTIDRTNSRWAACWFFYLANWTSQIYFSSQTFGLFFMIIILVFIISSKFFKTGIVQIGHYVFMLIVFAALTITHALTSIYGVLTVTVLWVTRQIKNINIPIILGVLFVVWSIWGATAQFDYNIPRFVSQAFSLDQVFKFAATVKTSTASASYLATCYERYLYSALFVVLAFMGFFLSRKYKEQYDNFVILLVIPAGLILISMVYGNEFWMRAFLFSLLPMAYFSVKLLRYKFTATILCVVFLVAIPLSILAFYGNASIDYLPKGEIAYWHFMVEHTAHGNVMGGIPITYLGYQNTILMPVNKDQIVANLNSDDNQPTIPQYIHVGDTDDNYTQYYYNDFATIPKIQSVINNSTTFNLIHMNPNT